MACITLIAPLAMATTQLASVIRYEDASTRQAPAVNRMSLHMSWVVATDRDGKRKLQICWEPSTQE